MSCGEIDDPLELVISCELVGDSFTLASNQFECGTRKIKEIIGKVDKRFEAIEKEIGEMSESLQRLPRLEQAIEGP